MKTAITIWNGRVAPVFDVARQCLLIENESRLEVPIPDGSAAFKASFFGDHNVSQVLCGAISREYENALVASGIEVISFIAGPLEQVLDAWRAGNLVQAHFSMPGCGCRRRRCRNRGQGHSLNR
ncbi:MAG TPA: NifB/NifX family molybdenum-iron cluster-binding protein [Treponemataceae bacterium]|nr:NifB/NifX family molybdenum-iron cluster-binding protein [Treponemataceae bacterium]